MAMDYLDRKERERGSLGHKLWVLRKRKRNTIAEVCRAVGMTSRTLSVIETNQVSPNLRTVLALCDYYGVTASWLLRGVTHVGPQPGPNDAHTTE